MKWFSGKTYDQAAGRESRSAFIAQAAFWFGAFKFLTNGMTIRLWRDYQINFGTTDAALLGVFLGTCLGLYWGRRHTDSQAIMTRGLPDTQQQEFMKPPPGASDAPVG